MTGMTKKDIDGICAQAMKEYKGGLMISAREKPAGFKINQDMANVDYYLKNGSSLVLDFVNTIDKMQR